MTNIVYSLANMKKHDAFVGDLLAPFENSLGLRFNNFQKPEDPKFNEPKKVNLRKQLRDAERKQEKIRKASPVEAKAARWKNALDRAQGIKIKDDPKRIRLAIKRKEAEKKKHKKQWAERTEKVEESKKLRQKKRKQELKKRKASKK